MKKIVQNARESEDPEAVKIVNSTLSDHPNDDGKLFEIPLRSKHLIKRFYFRTFVVCS